MHLLGLVLRLLLGLGRFELRLVAFLDLLDDPLAETIIASAADVCRTFEEHEHHGCVCLG